MEQIEVWNNIAKDWKTFRTKIPPTVEKFLDDKTGKILDLGCGSGRNFKKIDNLEWFGADFSPEMIELAKETSKEKEIESTLKVSESNRLPFNDNFFDSVLCYAVLHCIDSGEKRKETLQEIYRVLKKDGTALISSWGPKSPRLKNKEKDCFIPWTIKEETKLDRYTYVYELDELTKLCEEIGFQIISSWEERNVNLIIKKN